MDKDREDEQPSQPAPKRQRILNRWTNACIWESDHETLREAVVAAVESGTPLDGANLDKVNLDHVKLVGARFNGASFNGASFNDARFNGARFNDASFNGASFNGASFNDARFNYASFNGARFNGASFNDASFNGASSFSTNPFCKWRVHGKGDTISIGCKTKTVAEWDAFFAGTETYQTDRKSPEFLRILACYLAQRAWQMALAEGEKAATQ
jgi:Pentapeptide repeats (9 copies)/Pentapeptide repeats (8 copies)